jgi:hypothetical protein
VGYREAKKLQRHYTSGAPSPEEIESLDGEAFEARMKEWAKSAQSQDDQDDRQVFITRREMRQMAQLDPENFGRALDILKNR